MRLYIKHHIIEIAFDVCLIKETINKVSNYIVWQGPPDKKISNLCPTLINLL